MRLASFFMLALLCTLTMAAPQQNRPEDDKADQEVEEEKPVEKSSQKPVDLPKPSTESSKQVDLPKPTTESSKPDEAVDDANSDVRREEHKKIVPFQFHRVCRELDLKRQNCSCVWESTFEVNH